jgi:hypothetical protein
MIELVTPILETEVQFKNNTAWVKVYESSNEDEIILKGIDINGNAIDSVEIIPALEGINPFKVVKWIAKKVQQALSPPSSLPQA